MLVYQQKYSQIYYKTFQKKEKNQIGKSILLKKLLNSLRYTKKAAIIIKKMSLLAKFKILTTEIDIINITDTF